MNTKSTDKNYKFYRKRVTKHYLPYVYLHLKHKKNKSPQLCSQQDSRKQEKEKLQESNY